MFNAMSRQQIDAVTREAIWNAHGQRCFYCTHPVLFADVEIDHFIPESISADDYEGLLERGVIPADFDLLGPENLVPACRRHNCTKSDNVMSDTFVALQIVVIAKKAAEVRRTLAKQRKLYRLDQIFRHLQKGVDQGSFSAAEARDYMHRLRETTPMSELMGIGIPPEMPQILFSERAMQRLRHDGLSPEKLFRALERSASNQQLRVRRVGDDTPTYAVRLDANRRLIYSQLGDYIVVEDLLHHHG